MKVILMVWIVWGLVVSCQAVLEGTPETHDKSGITLDQTTWASIKTLYEED